MEITFSEAADPVKSLSKSRRSGLAVALLAAARPRYSDVVLGIALSTFLITGVLCDGANAERPKPQELDGLIEAVVRQRLAAGHVRSISGPHESPVQPVYEACLGLEDRSDPSDALLKRFRPPYRIAKLSECRRRGLDSEDELLIGPIRWRSTGEAEVEWNGLGNTGAYLVRREKNRWLVVGAIGGFVG